MVDILIPYVIPPERSLLIQILNGLFRSRTVNYYTYPHFPT